MSRILVGVPLAAALADDPTREWLREWLTEAGVAIPEFDAAGNRVPTRDELRHAIEQLPGILVEYLEDDEGRWYAQEMPGGSGPPAGSWFGEASLLPREDGGPPDHVGFRSGTDEAHWRILRTVSRTCGPQVWLDAGGSDPVMVTPSFEIPS
jgi:hypothetical protein